MMKKRQKSRFCGFNALKRPFLMSYLVLTND